MAQTVVPLKDDEHWKQVLEDSTKQLLVVNVHKDWSGPCTIMEPTMKRIYLETDNADQRLIFVSVGTREREQTVSEYVL